LLVFIVLHLKSDDEHNPCTGMQRRTIKNTSTIQHYIW
jgi:hypothetical protein